MLASVKIKRNWRSYTTRSGLCGLIWPNAGQLTRTKSSKDWTHEGDTSDAWSLEIDGMTYSLNAGMSEIFIDRCSIAQEGEGYNRSVMSLDVLGCTRNTIFIRHTNQFWKRGTGFCKRATNEEFLVTVVH